MGQGRTINRGVRALLAAVAVCIVAAFAAPLAQAAGEPAPPCPNNSDPSCRGGLLPPALTTSPGVPTGTTQVTQTLTRGTLGVWQGGSFVITEWLRCDVAGNFCVHTDDTDDTYLLTSADLGHTLRFRERRGDIFGQYNTADSGRTGTVIAVPPSNPGGGSLPSFTGTAKGGQTLTATPGTWDGTPPFTFQYRWLRCDSAGNNCNPVTAFSASATYKLAAADIGLRVRVRVLATGPDGQTGQIDSAASAVIAPDPPVNNSLPIISGTATDGQTLTTTNGTWTDPGTAGGGPATVFTRQWQRCSPACVNIPLATGTQYVLTGADFGSKIQVVVTATGQYGAASATSAQTATVGAIGPTNTSLPTITGVAKAGQTLTGHPGSWTGTAPITFAYKWQRCTPGCVDIPLATGLTYQAGAADIGATLRFVETATGPEAVASAAANTGVIADASPTNTTLPSISGTPQDGQTLTANDGVWNDPGNPPTATVFTRQWERCNPGCLPIGSATGTTYNLTPADVGAKIRVVVTATGAFGDDTATSAQTASVTATGPTKTSDPSIAGTEKAGQTLTGTNGTWSGTPTITITRKWQRCNAAGTPASCADIAGQTGATYNLVPADIGSTIRFVNTATGPQASDTASDITGVIANDPPVNDVPPSISGSETAGQTLTGTPGDWSGPTPINFSYKWQRCNNVGTACNDIGGATNLTYNLVAADIGNTVRFVETATNPVASASASDVSGVIAGDPPNNTVLPAISDTTPQDAQALTVTDGTWVNPTPTSFTRKWQRCTVPANACSDIPGATGSGYTVTSADYQHKLQVVTTAVGPFGNGGPVTSAQTAAVTALPPSNTAVPTITGTPTVGFALTGNKGTWAGTNLTFSYRWLLCDNAGANCAPTGDTDTSFTPGLADAGKKVRFEVTGDGPDDPPVVAVSSASAAIPTPVAPGAGTPTIAGTLEVGSTLTASPGFWTGSIPINFTYKWSRCDAGGCTDVGTGAIYTLSTPDVGKQIRLTVSGTNVAGSATGQSALSAVVKAKTVVTPPKKPVKKYKKMKPFPKVQIGGIVAPAGAFLNVFRVVNVPKGAKVTVKCRGRACPFKSTRRIKVSKKRANIKQLQKRGLFTGTVLEIRVTKKGFIGKYSRIKIRSNRAPARVDQCLQPGKTKPSKCPR